MGAGPQQQKWKLNRNDKHGNVDAMQLYKTQKLRGHQPTTAWNFNQHTKTSDAVGIDFHPHEHIESLYGYRPTATNTEFAWALHLQEQVRYLDGYSPIRIRLEIWMGQPIATNMVIGWVQAQKNMHVDAQQQTCNSNGLRPTTTKMEFTWA